MRKYILPFGSGEVETPIDQARLHGIWTSASGRSLSLAPVKAVEGLDANGVVEAHGAMCWKPQ
ncbi:hypothetical protein [Sphingopyxis sp. H050]|uniref:hypothetical protein n=1 Tax=Sphingopyxis sp. H050 TaxID=1759072 RepID=UPI0012E35679|nr:hypothetical protein [Sphingopyxis sp. H050]